MKYISGERIPIHLNKKDEHIIPYTYKGKENFFFWGIYPKVRVIELDQVAMNLGLEEASGVGIYEHIDFMDQLLIILSLGMYRVKRYDITFFGAPK
jgi:hypothetical protein